MDVLIVPPPGVEKSGWVLIRYLESALAASGLQVVNQEDRIGPQSAIVVFNDRLSARLRRILARVPKRNRILVVMEPEATGPSNYSGRTLARFGHTFFASTLWASRTGGESFFWPHAIVNARLPQMDPIERPFDTTMVCANKRSSVPQSLYQLRRDVLRAASAGNVKLALFGPNWNNSKMQNLVDGLRATMKGVSAGSRLSMSDAFRDLSFNPSEWHGPVGQKQCALRLAPTTLAIENSMDFVSEKLFDPILCGVVPVYVGPDLRKFGIPRSVALLAPADSRQILETVRSASPTQLDEVRAAGFEWIQSNAALQFDDARVMADLGWRIAQKLV